MEIIYSTERPPYSEITPENVAQTEVEAKLALLQGDENAFITAHSSWLGQAFGTHKSAATSAAGLLSKIYLPENSEMSPEVRVNALTYYYGAAVFPNPQSAGQGVDFSIKDGELAAQIHDQYDKALGVLRRKTELDKDWLGFASDKQIALLSHLTGIPMEKFSAKVAESIKGKITAEIALEREFSAEGDVESAATIYQETLETFYTQLRENISKVTAG